MGSETGYKRLNKANEKTGNKSGGPAPQPYIKAKHTEGAKGLKIKGSKKS